MYLIQKTTNYRSLVSQDLFNDLFRAEIYTDLLKSQCIHSLENVTLTELTIQDTSEKINVEDIEIEDCDFTAETLTVGFYLTDDYYISVNYDMNFIVSDDYEYENTITFDAIAYDVPLSNNNRISFKLNKATELVLNTFIEAWLDDKDINREIYDLIQNDHLNA